MAFSLSTISLAFPSKFQVELFRNQQHSQLDGVSQFRLCRQNLAAPISFMRVTMPYFDEPNNAKENLNVVKEKLWEAVPGSVKNFPWKRAESVLLERLVFLAKQVFKWSLVMCFVFGSLADVIFAVVRNQELMIPFGLLVGCLMIDFFKEISQEVFRSSEDNSLDWCFVGISYFCFLLKVVSAYLAVPSQVFLLHVANGGLMQVLWIWRNLFKGAGGKQENFSSNVGAS